MAMDRRDSDHGQLPEQDVEPGRLGDQACEAEARKKALAISPRAFDPRGAQVRGDRVHAVKTVERRTPPPIGSDAHPPLEDAPGSYVRGA